MSVPQRLRRLPVTPLALAGVAAGLAYVVSVGLFPYHSTNHDEAVYLQQALLLLDGQVFLQPPVEGAFRPWFFVESSRGLYSKYAPPAAGVFALGKLAGSFRYALPAVAGANTLLLYGVVREAWDHRTGAVAAAVLLCSPLFLVQSAVFLPYAPTTMLNLAFAVAYFRAERRESPRWAAVAGAAVGLAFFARPYTAVLFAAPFVAHAVWTLRGPLRDLAADPTTADRWRSALDTPLTRRRVATAGLGLAGVAVALGYNKAVTGHAFLFPYQAFAPLDGLGFGHREILGYEQDYTVWLALRSNAEALGEFVVDWGPFGVVGGVLAAAGYLVTVGRGWRWEQRVVAGIAATVMVGNIYFWGSRNVLGSLPDHSDGLVDTLGPYYHFDMLVPVSAFAAVALVAGFDWTRRVLASRTDGRGAAVGLAVVVLVASAALGGTAASVSQQPVSDNAALTDHYEAAYEPFEPSPPEDAVVFLPDPQGDWLNHPFQALRNDPGYDGDTVYALHDESLPVSAVYPDRALYRYVYRGDWSPYSERPVEPVLREVQSVSGDSLVVDAGLGLPAWTTSVTLTLDSEGEQVYYTLDGATQREAAEFEMVVSDGRARLTGPVSATGNETVPVDDEVGVEVLVDGGVGAGISYLVELPVADSDAGYRALSPYRELCVDLQNCGGEAAYVPGFGPDGTWMNATVRAQ
jgi:hypothetical protein